MAGLRGVVRADAQHRAGVATRPISHHDHTRPVIVWDPPQVILRKLKQQEINKKQGEKTSFTLPLFIINVEKSHSIKRRRSDKIHLLCYNINTRPTELYVSV